MNSKAKGNSFERDIAKALSLWWSRGESSSVFIRNPGSGMLGTVRNCEEAQLYGDIIATDDAGAPFTKLFHVELKVGYEKRKKIEGKLICERYDLFDVIDSEALSNPLYSFFTQTSDDAAKSGRIPVLVFKRRGRAPVTALPCEVFEVIQQTAKIALEGGFIMCGTVVFLPLDKFLRLLTRKDIEAGHYSSLLEKVPFELII